MRLLSTLSLLIFTLGVTAHNHEEPKFEGLLSSDVFDLDGGMELYVEKRSTCNAGSTPILVSASFLLSNYRIKRKC